MLLGAGACALVLAYNQFLAGSGDTPPPMRKKTVKKAAVNSSLYTPEDTKAKFAVYTEPVRNAFMPLVAGRNTQAKGPGSIDSLITGGEANWFYTGNIEVNGRAQALLENTGTGEAVYLAKGEKFKGTATVQDITPEHVVFSGPNGLVVAKLNDPTELKRNAGVGATNNVAPMNPANGLVGPIGGNPMASAPGAIDPTTGQPMVTPFNGMTGQPNPNAGGFGRRGRGGRGRGGFGGGGFGN